MHRRSGMVSEGGPCQTESSGMPASSAAASVKSLNALPAWRRDSLARLNAHVRRRDGHRADRPASPGRSRRARRPAGPSRAEPGDRSTRSRGAEARVERRPHVEPAVHRRCRRRPSRSASGPASPKKARRRRSRSARPAGARASCGGTPGRGRPRSPRGEQRGEDGVAPRAGRRGGMAQRIQHRRRLREAGEQRGLASVRSRAGRAKNVSRRGLRPVGVVAVEDVVEIGLQDPRAWASGALEPRPRGRPRGACGRRSSARRRRSRSRDQLLG